MVAAFSSTSVVAAAALLTGSISSSVKLSPAYTTIASLSKNLSSFSLISNPLLSHNPLTLTASATSKRSFTCKSQSSPPDSTTPTRLETFQIFYEALGKKCGGDSNMKFAWYGGSKNEIRDIISHGFTHCKEPENRGLYGVGVSLPPAKFSMESALLLDDDDNGLRHILLCRVILGKMEQICEGSKQFHRSSEEFDSGVYDLAEPRRYIVWNSYMISHILPNFIISFKASRFLIVSSRIFLFTQITLHELGLQNI